MKNPITFLLIIIMTFFMNFSFAQKKASPAATAKGEIDGVSVTVDYHQPSSKGRKVMGELVPFDELWRTGANDATVIEFSENVKVEGKNLSAGKYALFTIPGEKEWVVIFNKESKQWGAYNYDEKEDVLRVNVSPSKVDMTETFVFNVEQDGVSMQWENTKVKFNVSK